MAYRVLAGGVGLAWLLAGAGFFAMFFGYHAPGGRPEGLFSTMGPQGHYVAGIAGCALLVWGGVLLGAARKPVPASGVAGFTALGLVLCAVQRMAAFVVGDYAALATVLRIEAAAFLILALGFVWLAPRRSPVAA